MLKILEVYGFGWVALSKLLCGTTLWCAHVYGFQANQCHHRAVGKWNSWNEGMDENLFTVFVQKHMLKTTFREERTSINGPVDLLLRTRQVWCPEFWRDLRNQTETLAGMRIGVGFLWRCWNMRRSRGTMFENFFSTGYESWDVKTPEKRQRNTWYLPFRLVRGRKSVSVLVL